VCQVVMPATDVAHAEQDEVGSVMRLSDYREEHVDCSWEVGYVRK